MAEPNLWVVVGTVAGSAIGSLGGALVQYLGGLATMRKEAQAAAFRLEEQRQQWDREQAAKDLDRTREAYVAILGSAGRLALLCKSSEKDAAPVLEETLRAQEALHRLMLDLPWLSEKQLNELRFAQSAISEGGAAWVRQLVTDLLKQDPRLSPIGQSGLARPDSEPPGKTTER